MGCCCAKYQVSGDGAEATTPLLHSPTRSVKAASDTKSYQATGEVSPVDILPEPVEVKPVKVDAIDRRFQDQAEAYHKYLKKYKDLQNVVQELKTAFPDQNKDKTLRGCLNHIKHSCDDPEAISVLEQPECPKLDYKSDRLDQQLVGQLVAFNNASSLTEDLLLKGPSLTASIKDLTASEMDLRKDILESSLGPEGPDCLQRCLHDITQFQKVAKMIDHILRETHQIAERLKRAVAVLKKLEAGNADTRHAAVDTDVLLMKDDEVKPSEELAAVGITSGSAADDGGSTLVAPTKSTDDSLQEANIITEETATLTAAALDNTTQESDQHLIAPESPNEVAAAQDQPSPVKMTDTHVRKDVETTKPGESPADTVTTTDDVHLKHKEVEGDSQEIDDQTRLIPEAVDTSYDQPFPEKTSTESHEDQPQTTQDADQTEEQRSLDVSQTGDQSYASTDASQAEENTFTSTEASPTVRQQDQEEQQPETEQIPEPADQGQTEQHQPEAQQTQPESDDHGADEQIADEQIADEQIADEQIADEESSSVPTDVDADIETLIQRDTEDVQSPPGSPLDHSDVGKGQSSFQDNTYSGETTTFVDCETDDQTNETTMESAVSEHLSSPEAQRTADDDDTAGSLGNSLELDREISTPPCTDNVKVFLTPEPMNKLFLPNFNMTSSHASTTSDRGLSDFEESTESIVLPDESLTKI